MTKKTLDCGCTEDVGEIPLTQFQQDYEDELMNLVWEAVGFATSHGESHRHARLLAALGTLSKAVGVMDALACMHGVAQVDRMQTIHKIAEGREETMREHDERCEGCADGERLRREIAQARV